MKIKYYLWGLVVPGALLSAAIFGITISDIILTSLPILYAGIVQSSFLHSLEAIGIFILEGLISFFTLAILAYNLNSWIKPLIGIDSKLHRLKVMTAGISGFVGVCAANSLFFLEMHDPYLMMFGSAIGGMSAMIAFYLGELIHARSIIKKHYKIKPEFHKYYYDMGSAWALRFIIDILTGITNGMVCYAASNTFVEYILDFITYNCGYRTMMSTYFFLQASVSIAISLAIEPIFLILRNIIAEALSIEIVSTLPPIDAKHFVEANKNL